MCAAAGRETGRLHRHDRARITEIGRKDRGDTNDYDRVTQYLLGGGVRNQVEVGVLGMPVIALSDRAGWIVVPEVDVTVAGLASLPMLGLMPMREAMAHLGQEEGRGQDQGQ